MPASFVQGERWLTLDTPLGKDALLATEAEGSEAISSLFEFTISAISGNDAIEPEKLLGKSATLCMARAGGKPRFVNGIVVSLAAGGVTRGAYRRYRLTLAPALWVLGRTSDYKVFQDKSAVDIVEATLSDAGIACRKKLSGIYRKRDYCVQFGETDLAFMQRLLAEEGIFYFFTHDQNGHTLVLADQARAYGDCAQDKVAYRPDGRLADAVHAMHFSANLTETSWVMRDFDFTRAAVVESERKTVLKPAKSKGWEHLRYPGGGREADHLKAHAEAAVEAAEAGFEIVTGAGSCASFTPGHRFELAEHPVAALAGTRHVVTEVRHRVRDPHYFTYRALPRPVATPAPPAPAAPGQAGPAAFPAMPAQDESPFYENDFTAIPHERVARGRPPAQKPVVRGPLTAMVVGPKDEEIHTDEYGRVRLQFHWDRHGEANEKSSCFVRVAQGLAGSGWGMVFVPRIGMEVVVQFLDGDPDKPLVTGAVYNGSNKPPWALPKNGSKSGLLTRSSKNGSAETANELSFEDKTGEEKILLHAEKDFLREVENDETVKIGHDLALTVENHRTATVSKGNDKLTISQGNQQITISQGNQTVKLDLGSVTMDAANGITLKCGESTIKLSQKGIEIKGIAVKVAGMTKAETKAPMVDISADAMANIKGGMVKIN